MSGHHYSRRAERDLDEILDYYIGKKRVSSGRKVLSSIERDCRRHAESPNIGVPCNELCPRMRYAICGSYLIFYFALDDWIEVVRVLHSSRDITPEMFPSDM